MTQAALYAHMNKKKDEDNVPFERKNLCKGSKA
jgi:hypothetical protein